MRINYTIKFKSNFINIFSESQDCNPSNEEMTMPPAPSRISKRKRSRSPSGSTGQDLLEIEKERLEVYMFFFSKRYLN
jgi:hypothetical protein